MVNPLKSFGLGISGRFGRRADTAGPNPSAPHHSPHTPPGTHTPGGGASKQSKGTPRGNGCELALRKNSKTPTPQSAQTVQPPNLAEVHAQVGERIRRIVQGPGIGPEHRQQSASHTKHKLPTVELAQRDPELAALNSRLDALNNRPVENGKMVSLDKWQSILEERLKTLGR